MARIKRKTTTVVTRQPRRPYSRNFHDIYANLTNQVQEQGQTVTKTRVGILELLCGNSSSNSNPTPGILKTTRFRFQGSITYVSASAPSRQFVKLGLIYIPEVERNMIANWTGEQTGTYLQQALVNEPERLLAYKNVPLTPVANGSYGVTISSKLSRNLKSGDGVFLFLMTGYNGGDPALASTIIVRGEVTFYTRYN